MYENGVSKPNLQEREDFGNILKIWIDAIG